MSVGQVNHDFGLYFVDLDKDPELKRIETSEVAVYQEIIHRVTGGATRP